MQIRRHSVVRIFKADQLREAGEYIKHSQSHYMVRAEHHSDPWASGKWTGFFDPDKLIFWESEKFEKELAYAIDLYCANYGYERNTFKIIVKPLLWFIDRDGEREQYDTLDEMLFLEGVESWRELKKLGAGYEIDENGITVKPQQRREYSLDELAEEL